MGNNKTFYDLQVKNLVKKFDNKTQNNLSTSKRILIDGKDMFYLEFIEKIFNNEFKGGKSDNKSKILYAGYLGDYLLNLFATMDVDLSGYILAFDTDNIYHSINNHITEREVKRGQISLNVDDFKNLPIILGNVISMERKGKNTMNQDGYFIICKTNDYSFYIFEATSIKKKTLLFNTMWKK